MAEDVEINAGAVSSGPGPTTVGNHDDSMEVVTMASPSAGVSQCVGSSGDADSQIQGAGTCGSTAGDVYQSGLVVGVTREEDMVTACPVTESASSVMAADTATASPIPLPSSATLAPTVEVPDRSATPNHVHRSGSLGELGRVRGVVTGSRDKDTINIRENLDVSPLPRPPNPGGILPLNGDAGSGNTPLDLIINGRERRRNLSMDSQFESPRSFLHDTGIYRHGAGPAGSGVNTFINMKDGDLVSTSRDKLWSCSINEGVERPLPSSVVDSEGVAKKIARLDHQLPCSSSLDSLWSGSMRTATQNDHLSSVRTIVDRTPPARPKPPRPKLSPFPDQTIVSTSGESSIPSDNLQVSSPGRSLSPSTAARSLVRDADTTPHRERSPEVTVDPDNGLYRVSPDDVSQCQASMFYKCRFCNFTAGTYNQLQMHMPRHGGSLRGMKCPLCDYTTNDKSNFRRHRRLHVRNNPISVLKCGKCSYSSTSDRKMREHYQQAHNDLGTPGMLTEPINDNAMFTPLGGRYPGSRGVGSFMGYNGACNGSMGDPMVNGIGTVMMTGQGAVGYPYSPANRQPLANCSFDVFTGNPPCGNLRNVRDGNQMTSNYLRSIVSSVMNSQTPQRQQASSTITSSSYLMPTLADSSQNVANMDTGNDRQGGIGVINNSHSHEGHPVKVKVEPIDIDGASDVSSSGSQYNVVPSDTSCHAKQHAPHHCTGDVSTCVASVCPNGSIDLLSPTCSVAQNGSVCRQRSLDSSCSIHNASDLPRPRDLRVSTQSDVLPRWVDIENGSEIHTSFNPSVSNSGMTQDSTTRGTQCILPVVKTEVSPDMHVCHFDCCGGRHFRPPCVDRAVQCDLSLSTTSSNVNRSQRNGRHTHSASESDSAIGDSQCSHCGICFDDEVMFSIHVGCHSHTDPFTCNICGKPCANKYGFYSHVMRGHHL